MKKNNRSQILVAILIICLLVGCKTNKSLNKKDINPNNINSEIQEKKAEITPQNQLKPEQGSVKKPEVPPAKKSESQPAPKVEVPKKKNNLIIFTFNTTILDYDENRVSNIRLAAQKINGYILKPGEVFSFNNIVGKRDSNKGYKKAKVLVNGKADYDVGGGICQLSSTLYNAAIKSGMEIIERHTHSGEVGYVTRGQDAAVSYGYKDLKFKNKNNYPVKFIVSVKNGKVYVSTIKVVDI